MAPKIELGKLSAEEDESFQQHFIETQFLQRLSSNQCDIIYGSKGVGKTALMRALAEINANQYYRTMSIDLGSISFEAIHHQLSKLNATTKTEIPNLARTTWKNILLNYALFSFSESLNETDPLKLTIHQILDQEGFLSNTNSQNDREVHFQVMNVIERIFRKMSQLPVEGLTLTGLTAKQQNVVNHFPLNEKIIGILEDVVNKITATKQKLLICLDGFDSIVDHSPDSRKAIFAGLIDAILKLSSDTTISKAFCFKAFLPHELTLDANLIAWDIDKHANKIHYLRWGESDFRSFIEKRLLIYSKRKSSKFIDIWNEFLPEKIMNNTHAVEENTFEYILRHTLYRPRQVLNHIQNIFTQWEFQNNSSTRIDPSFIPQVIASTNYEMAQRVSSQLAVIYPSIIYFLRSWQNSPGIIDVKTFTDRIKKYFPEFRHTEINKFLDELFNFGIIGLKADNPASTSVSKKLNFRFAFVGDNFGTYIHTSVRENDIFAFSPMFREFCGSNSSADGYINPIALTNFL